VQVFMRKCGNDGCHFTTVYEKVFMVDEGSKHTSMKCKQLLKENGYKF
jgi:hypothetical protein